jgi:outer membrane protein assembly factor BamB
LGNEPKSELIPRGRQFQIDWVGRQLATALDGDAMYVSNRFQVTAYDLQSGEQRWQSQPPHAKPLRSQDWGLIPMRPLVTGERIFARLLYENGPLLIGLNQADGSELWTLPSSYNRQIVSDPLLVQGQLFVMLVNRLPEGDNVLQLAMIDHHTGHLLRTVDLLRLGETWWRRRCCEVAPTADGLIAVLGGFVLHCSLTGQLQWVRESPLLPANEEPRWVQQHYQRAMIADGKAYVVQPGVASVQCLKVATGQQVWSVVLPDVQRLVGITEGRLLLQTDAGVLALDAASGQRQWQQSAGELLTGVALCADQTVLLVQRRKQEDDAAQAEPHWVWLRTNDGREQFAVRMDGLTHPDPRLGPLVTAADRIWTFSGQGHDDPARDVVEIAPAR